MEYIRGSHGPMPSTRAAPARIFSSPHPTNLIGHGVAWAIAPSIALIRAIHGSIVRGQPLPESFSYLSKT